MKNHFTPYSLFNYRLDLSSGVLHQPLPFPILFLSLEDREPYPYFPLSLSSAPLTLLYPRIPQMDLPPRTTTFSSLTNTAGTYRVLFRVLFSPYLARSYHLGFPETLRTPLLVCPLYFFCFPPLRITVLEKLRDTWFRRRCFCVSSELNFLSFFSFPTRS